MIVFYKVVTKQLLNISKTTKLTQEYKENAVKATQKRGIRLNAFVKFKRA